MLRLYRGVVEVEVFFLVDKGSPEFSAIDAAEEALGDGGEVADVEASRVRPGDAIPDAWVGAIPYGERTEAEFTVGQIARATNACAVLSWLMGAET